MAREIGGYFELEKFVEKTYHPGAIALNCGRGCLAYLVELRSMEAIWLPDFLCDSVPKLFSREGVKVHTYQVGVDFLPVYDFEVKQDEWMLLVDYYGQLSSAGVESAMAASGGRLIVDETQDFFRSPWEGVDTVYTCRKWFGVSDGAYLYTGDGKRLERDLPVDESYSRMGFVLGRFERTASEFYGQSCDNNTLFANEPVKRMSPITANILSAVDYKNVKAARRANWAYLHDNLKERNLLNLEASEAPFAYPLQLKGIDPAVLRKRLAAERVYVPVLWPNVMGDPRTHSIACDYAASILPLPIDQRYDREDMDFMLSLLKED